MSPVNSTCQPGRRPGKPIAQGAALGEEVPHDQALKARKGLPIALSVLYYSHAQTLGGASLAQGYKGFQTFGLIT